MGARALYTYTDRDEPGTSLRAAGWIFDGLTDGGEWTRPSRQRSLAICASEKRRWRPAWSPPMSEVEDSPRAISVLGAPGIQPLSADSDRARAKESGPSS
jgi:hypothetical protein